MGVAFVSVYIPCFSDQEGSAWRLQEYWLQWALAQRRVQARGRGRTWDPYSLLLFDLGELRAELQRAGVEMVLCGDLNTLNGPDLKACRSGPVMQEGKDRAAKLRGWMVETEMVNVAHVLHPQLVMHTWRRNTAWSWMTTFFAHGS